MAPFFLFVGTVAVAWAITGSARRYAVTRSMIDVPNERSSHVTPTPRGGGLGIVSIWAVAIPALWGTGLLDGREALALWAGPLAVAAIGWWDDHANLGPLPRLATQGAAAVWTVLWLGGFPTLDTGSGVLHMGGWGGGVAVVTLVWFANLYNFMDGIDGLAGCEAATAGITMSILLYSADATGLALAAVLVAAGAVGFLIWNWPPARIFMGDIGSGFLGFSFCALALAAERNGELPAAVLLLPLAVFVCDATLTLFRRALRGERIFEAHRSHAYQRLAQLGWSHRRISMLVAALNVGLGVAAWMVVIGVASLPGAALAAVGGVVASGWILLRVAERRANAAADVVGRRPTGEASLARHGRDRT